MPLFNNVLAGAAGQSGGDAGYKVERSLRFNKNDQAYLSKTFSSDGNRRKWTWSGWVKRCTVDASNHDRWLAVSGTSTDTCFFIGFADTDDKLSIQFGYTTNYKLISKGVFRDPSAWYSVVVGVDATQTTATDKVKVYINGVELEAGDFATDQRSSIPDTDWGINKANLQHEIGKSFSSYLNGYLADVHFVDGQQLAATNFGEFDADTGVWSPKKPIISSPNDGTVWSNSTVTTGTIDSSYPLTNAFNGSIAQPNTRSSGANTTITITLPKAPFQPVAEVVVGSRCLRVAAVLHL